MPFLAPEALRGNANLLDPAFLDKILRDCSNRASGPIRKANITCVALLLIFSQENLLQVDNFGKGSANSLNKVLETYGYTLGQASSLFIDYQEFIRVFSYQTIRNVFQEKGSSRKFINFSLALRAKLAEWYDIPILPPEPAASGDDIYAPPVSRAPLPPEQPIGEGKKTPPRRPRSLLIDEKQHPLLETLSLNIPVPTNIARTLEQSPDRLAEFTGFCQDAFENAVRYHIAPDQAPYSAPNAAWSPTNCTPVCIEITLRHKWREIFQPSFLYKIAQDLSGSAALLSQIQEEFKPEIS